jgi:hypothetical protein
VQIGTSPGGASNSTPIPLNGGSSYQWIGVSDATWFVKLTDSANAAGVNNATVGCYQTPPPPPPPPPPAPPPTYYSFVLSYDEIVPGNACASVSYSTYYSLSSTLGAGSRLLTAQTPLAYAVAGYYSNGSVYYTIDFNGLMEISPTACYFPPPGPPPATTPGYNCDGLNCVYVADGATYSSLRQCNLNCGSQP